jgi:antitoxin (DNA-binding transcriptional repressor) of toxin-antitoxin stability system
MDMKMTTIGAFEAKTHFSRLLEQVEQGDRIVITRHGKSVAMLCRLDGATSRSPKEVIGKLKAFRQKHGMVLTRDEIKDMIGEGRL